MPDHRPRVAFVRSRYTAHGGAERFVERTLAVLRERADLTLITRKWSDAGGFETLGCNPFHVGRLWRDWSFARCACDAVHTGRFDIVQSHERIACCDIYRAGDGVHREWLAQRARSLGILGRAAQMFSPYHAYVKHAEKRLFTSPRLKAVICNSRMIKDEIVRHFGLPESMLHIIYSGVDLEAFHPRLREHRSAVRARYRIPDSAQLLLFVGSGFARKGLETLLQAMASAPGSTRLLVVGRDKRQKDYEAQAGRLGLGERIYFAGGQQDVKPFYGAADAFALPTVYDPFPNAALEAMASGLPVITSTKSGAAELIENGDNGFVCDALDRVSLTDAIAHCRGEVAARMGARAREVAERFGIARMGAELLALYGRILDEKNNDIKGGIGCASGRGWPKSA